MNWDLVFTITNNYALVMWLILAFAPRRTVIMTGLFYGGTGLLATSYAVIVVPLMTGMIDGGSGGIPDFSTLAGVQQLLSSPGGATIGWIHYLAFDLFVGLWVARNAGRWDWFFICCCVSRDITRLQMPLYPNKTVELKFGGKCQSPHGKDLKKVK